MRDRVHKENYSIDLWFDVKSSRKDIHCTYEMGKLIHAVTYFCGDLYRGHAAYGSAVQLLNNSTEIGGEDRITAPQTELVKKKKKKKKKIFTQMT